MKIGRVDFNLSKPLLVVLGLLLCVVFAQVIRDFNSRMKKWTVGSGNYRCYKASDRDYSMTLYENGHVDIYGGVGGYGYQHVGMYERNGNTIYIYEFGNSPNPDNANWKLTASEDGRILTSTEEEGETVFHETVRSYERQPHKQTPPDNVLPTESTK